MEENYIERFLNPCGIKGVHSSQSLCSYQSEQFNK